MTIKISLDKTTYKPGEAICGFCEWQSTSNKPPKWVMVSLFWYTEGYCGEEIHVVQQLKQNPSETSGVVPFDFSMPAYPQSYKGKLFKIHWALEAGLGRGGVDRKSLISDPMVQS